MSSFVLKEEEVGGGGGAHTCVFAFIPGCACVHLLPTCAFSTACMVANEKLTVSAQKRSEAEKKTFAKFFSECQKAVDSKQLRPMTRTQYQRTAFQVCRTARATALSTVVTRTRL